MEIVLRIELRIQLDIQFGKVLELGNCDCELCCGFESGIELKVVFEIVRGIEMVIVLKIGFGVFLVTLTVK